MTKPVLFFFIVFLWFSLSSSAQNIAYTVGSVYNFKKGIVSLTFDDGFVEHFTKVVPLLDLYGYKGTFYVITNSLNDSLLRQKVFEAYQNYHEIGSHTVTHPVLTNLSHDSVYKELEISRNFINMVCHDKYACLSFCYPYSYFNRYSLQSATKLYLSSRTLNNGFNVLGSFSPWKVKSKPFMFRSTIHEFNSFVQKSIDNRSWLVEVYHRINEPNKESIMLDSLESHLKFLKKHEKDLWIAPISDVIKYNIEAKNLTLTCEICNDSILKFRIDDFLNDSLYNHPLSIKVFLPQSWTQFSLLNLSEPKDTTFQHEYLGNNSLILNVVPKNDLFQIKPTLVNFNQSVLFRLVEFAPNPLTQSIEVKLELMTPGEITTRIIDSNGQLIKEKICSGEKGLYNLDLEDSRIVRGSFYLAHFLIKTELGNSKFTKKFLIP